jgi:molecular chaperone DnaK (HSP70)
VAPLSRRAEPELVLGVDLGTSHVRVAVFSQGQLLLLTPATEELPGLPAMVAPADPAAPDGEALVGEAARERRLEAPGQVAAGLKRLLGRRGRSARMLEHAVWAVPAVRTDAQGLAALALGGHTVAVGGLAAQLLREVAAVAARQLGRPVRRAVLCVPSHFTDAQRGALLAAARQAGLEVLRLVNEASAAALAFGQGRALARKRLLIYDLGGGTFDASVVEVTGDDVEVVSTGGDNFLGGVDLDARVEYELRRQMTEAGLAPPAPDSPEGERLRGAAEAAKRALSAHEEVEVTLASVARDAQGLPADFSTPLSRTRLEELTADLVERTLEVTLDVVRAASVTPQGLDEVLLLGGQSRSPHVRRRLEEALGRPVRAGEDVEASVARGAALLGHALVRAAQGKGPVVLAEVLSTPVGIAERGGTFRRVLERNTRLPAQKTLVLPVRAGEPLSLALLQGSAPLVEDNEFLGARTLQPERDGELQVHFDMGADGTLALAVTPPGGKRAELALERAEPDAEGLAGLLAAAPPGEAPPPGPGGLLGGLKRLFGRR